MKPPRRGELEKLAGVITLVGSPSDDVARDTYYAIMSVFGNHNRRNYFKSTLDNIPADRDRILRITDCVQAYQRIVRPQTEVELDSTNLKLKRVTGVMLEIPDGNAYVQWCREEGIYHPGAIFHPNTLNRAQDELKGVFGYAESMEHGEQLDSTKESEW